MPSEAIRRGGLRQEHLPNRAATRQENPCRREQRAGSAGVRDGRPYDWTGRGLAATLAARIKCSRIRPACSQPGDQGLPAGRPKVVRRHAVAASRSGMDLGRERGGACRHTVSFWFVTGAFRTKTASLSLPRFGNNCIIGAVHGVVNAIRPCVNSIRLYVLFCSFFQ